jgi:hypothetical protein
MKVDLDLSRHCIETEMKRQYNKNISAYFKRQGRLNEPDKQALEAQIELLQQGLESFDFNRLRAQHPELRGEIQAEVALAQTSEDAPEILINGKAINGN